MKLPELVIDPETKKLITFIHSQGKSDRECLELCQNASTFLKTYKRVGKAANNTWELIRDNEFEIGPHGSFDDFVVGNAFLDRIDPSKGYTPDNVRWIHVDVARAKVAFCDNGKHTDEEFILMCNKVAKTHPRSLSNTRSRSNPKNKMLR